MMQNSLRVLEIFSTIEAINRPVELGKKYNVEEFDPNSDKYMCLDPGYPLVNLQY